MSSPRSAAGANSPGAAERFTELAGAVALPVRRYLVRRTDPDTAQDVASEVMLVLWRRLDDVPPGDPLPWCYAVARRCLANAQRASRRRARLLARLRLEPSVGPPALDDAPLHEALSQLRQADREVLRLWAWEFLEAREIATVLGISSNAASIRLHRAKRRLAAALAEVAPTGKAGPLAGHTPLEGEHGTRRP